MRSVVTGANRGIGFEFVRQMIARGDDVVAGVRRPDRADSLRALAAERLRILTLDVADPASVVAFARELGDEPVDLLINNAGIVGDRGELTSLDAEDLSRTFLVNAVGPVLVTRALLPNLRRGQARKVVHLSSGMGSIGDNTSGGSYGYRMSKAALNMASRNLAHDLKLDGIMSVVLNPGWVQTDMGGPDATLPVGESVRRMLGIIDKLTIERTGQFLNHTGEPYEW
jgi:NAD(P)-dependent dehydrogenase (short-subunit alcohol dehydrogenase family)